jgi:hypothetical protein
MESIGLPATRPRPRRQADTWWRDQTLVGLTKGICKQIFLGSDDRKSQGWLSRDFAPTVLHHQTGDRHKADRVPGGDRYYQGSVVYSRVRLQHLRVAIIKIWGSGEEKEREN